MHTIEPARLKSSVLADSLPDPAATEPTQTAPSRLIRGKALIFWDPMSLPGTKFAKKRDAIDTDQITPAADCVSESLETLDEKWKAGSFRHLMPDFRERVHRGQTFVIAGDRFAIGSSREMSPAGLKGVAEEAGLEMVVVCGQNMASPMRRAAGSRWTSSHAVPSGREARAGAVSSIERRSRDRSRFRESRINLL